MTGHSSSSSIDLVDGSIGNSTTVQTIRDAIAQVEVKQQPDYHRHTNSSASSSSNWDYDLGTLDRLQEHRIGKLLKAIDVHLYNGGETVDSSNESSVRRKSHCHSATSSSSSLVAAAAADDKATIDHSSPCRHRLIHQRIAVELRRDAIEWLLVQLNLVNSSTRKQQTDLSIDCKTQDMAFRPPLSSAPLAVSSRPYRNVIYSSTVKPTYYSTTTTKLLPARHFNKSLVVSRQLPANNSLATSRRPDTGMPPPSQRQSTAMTHWLNNQHHLSLSTGQRIFRANPPQTIKTSNCRPISNGLQSSSSHSLTDLLQITGLDLNRRKHSSLAPVLNKDHSGNLHHRYRQHPQQFRLTSNRLASSSSQPRLYIKTDIDGDRLMSSDDNLPSRSDNRPTYRLNLTYPAPPNTSPTTVSRSNRRHNLTLSMHPNDSDELNRSHLVIGRSSSPLIGQTDKQLINSTSASTRTSRSRLAFNQHVARRQQATLMRNANNNNAAWPVESSFANRGTSTNLRPIISKTNTFHFPVNNSKNTPVRIYSRHHERSINRSTLPAIGHISNTPRKKFSPSRRRPSVVGGKSTLLFKTSLWK